MAAGTSAQQQAEKCVRFKHLGLMDSKIKQRCINKYQERYRMYQKIP
jgi:hypothetical protein